MPLNLAERSKLFNMIDKEFCGGMTPMGAAPDNSASEGFMIAAERLMSQMAVLTDVMTAFVQHVTNRAFGQPAQGHAEDPQPQPPKNKGGRPRKEQTQAPQQVQGNGQAPEDVFGDPNAKPQEDPLGVPDAPPPPPPPQQAMTDVQVKDALRAYMQAWGTEGTNRLTDLLTRVAGVKRFSDLPANKWGAVVQAAQQEMTQAK